MLNLNTQKALEFLLQETYLKEFESIDGLSQHPDAINFYEWLFKRKIITEGENIKHQKRIKEEYNDE